MFTKGQEYQRRDIHNLYGGQEQGGISTPANHNMILLFSSPRGQESGYVDGWTDQGIYLYTGEGQRGDMVFTRGNAAIRDHVANGKELHLFEQSKRGYAVYIGQMMCQGYHYRQGPDAQGQIRQMIVFELKPVD